MRGYPPAGARPLRSSRTGKVDMAYRVDFWIYDELIDSECYQTKEDAQETSSDWNNMEIGQWSKIVDLSDEL